MVAVDAGRAEVNQPLRTALDLCQEALQARIALAALPLAAVPVRLALSDQNGRALLPMLATPARIQLAVGLFLTIGLLLIRP